jgi:hypothetical protein
MGIVVSAALHGGAALILLAALSLIGFAAMPSRLRPRRAVLTIPASLAVGSLAVGWTSFLAGTFIGTAAILPLFAAGVLASLIRARAWARDVRRCLARLVALARANLLATAVLAVIGLLVVPQLLLPLVDSDGLAYHVALPKLYVLTGHVWFVPWTVTSALVQSMEMIYLIGFRLAGGETAKFLHFGYFLASLGTLALAVHRGRRTRAAAMLAPLLYASAPVVLAPAGAAFVDHAATFFVLTGALILFRRGPALLAGIALGAAIAAKITVAPAVVGLFVWATFDGLKPVLHRAVAIAVPLIVAFLPFGLRNVRNTGDPIYPLGYVLLHRDVPGITADRVAYAAQFHSSVPGPLGIAWTLDPEHVQTDEVAGLHHAIGLLALALAIRFRWTRRWLALIVPCLIVALVFRPPTRYYLPMFAALAALEAYALVLLSRRIATVVAIAAAAPALIAAAVPMLTFPRPAELLLGRMNRDAYLTRHVPGFAAAQVINRQPPGGWVMALDFPAPYYFDRPWIAEGVLNDPPLQRWIAEARSADDVVRRLRANDVRYLVVTPGYGSGTRNALLPLARDRRQAEIILALRRRLILLANVDRVDVLAVGR